MQDHDKIKRFLTTVPLFKGLDDRQLSRLTRRFSERSYGPGESIVTQGTIGIGLFIMESGKADAVREHPGGEKTVVNTFGPTEFFGELSLLDEEPRTASVVATEPTKCLILTQLDFLSALREDADVSIALLKELARRYRRAVESL
ncbi:MAG: cyclic nucleotide-binding domain-containing protein [Anaerolineae bacterium]|nr:cyclic nucleotide-binding domain-containing protein [Anaerolineae bacterium]